jgi:uncharacterized protein (DUF433 family)
MTTTIDIGSLIESNSKIYNGSAVIAGTRIPVYRLIMDYKNGLSVNDILQELPHLNLAQIYSALAYYHANKKQIEAEITAYQEDCLFWENEYNTGKIQ